MPPRINNTPPTQPAHPEARPSETPRPARPRKAGPPAQATTMPAVELPPPLPRSFYDRDTVVVARELLGKLLVRRLPGGAVRIGRVVECEAYHGFEDAASHAFGGPTPRSGIMFGPPGFAYVYQIYGVWFCLNAVTGPPSFPSAVLLRAVALPGDDPRVGAGPGKLCRALEIDKRQNGADLTTGVELWFGDDGTVVRPRDVASGLRIGVDYAGEWAEMPWRFFIADHPSVSRLPPRRQRRS